MGRVLKLVAAVCALVAGGAVALAAGSAPAQTRSQMIVCPLEANDTVTAPCCGPPIATAAATSASVCCGTPQPINCPLELTLTSSTDPSVAGHRVTLSGRWPGSTAGQTVVLWQKLPNAKTFSRAAQTKTGSAGAFSFVRRGVETNRKWYVTVGSQHSTTLAQRVQAVVTVNLRGHKAYGRVKPNHAGERVLVEQETPSGWHVVARPRLSRHSTYSATLPAGGQSVFRTVFRGDRRNVRSSAGVGVAA